MGDASISPPAQKAYTGTTRNSLDTSLFRTQASSIERGAHYGPHNSIRHIGLNCKAIGEEVPCPPHSPRDTHTT